VPHWVWRQNYGWARQTTEGRRNCDRTTDPQTPRVQLRVTRRDIGVARHDIEVARRNIETTRCDLEARHVGSWDAASGGRKPNNTRRRRERRDQRGQGETTELGWIRVLGTIPPSVRGRGWSQVNIQREGRASTPRIAGKLPTSWTGATHKDIIGALKGRYGDHQLAAAYRVQLKATIQLIGESLSVCNSRRADGAPGPCRATCGLHLGGGNPCICRQTETEKWSSDGRRQVA
jgi:hypothetical protein